MLAFLFGRTVLVARVIRASGFGADRSNCYCAQVFATPACGANESLFSSGRHTIPATFLHGTNVHHSRHADTGVLLVMAHVLNPPTNYLRIA